MSIKLWSAYGRIGRSVLNGLEGGWFGIGIE